MAELVKIQKICEQFTLTSASANQWFTKTINKNTLNLPGDSLPTTGSNYDVVYFVDVTVLCLGGNNTTDGVKKLSAALVWSNTSATLNPVPAISSQNAAQEVFIVNDWFDIWIIGHTSQAGPIPGTPVLVDNEINVVVQAVSSFASPGRKFKLFIDIFSYGDNTL